MDYKEKYEQALNVASQWHKDGIGDVKTIVECIFPELRESEDEKIRKEIISFITDRKSWFPKEETKSSWIAWLKKQGEKTEPIEGFNTEFERQISHLIASIINKEYEYTKDFVKWTSNALLNYAKKQGEQKPAWSKEDERNLEGIINEIEANKNDAPDYDLATYDRFLSWLKSLKDRIQPQPKQEWSDEDKAWIDRACMLLDELNHLETLTLAKIPHNVNEIISHIKSLKPNHWKPSEEQLSSLGRFIEGVYGCVDFTNIKSLYNELKQL